MKTQNGRRRWIAGTLRAGRVAAFLTLATGINGTIAALQPRYEPIYVYLIAIVVVAWLGGALLGITAAIASVVLYDSMFAPLNLGLSMSSLVPFAIAVGAAVLTSAVRAPLEKHQFAAPPARPLLEPTPATVVSVMPAVDTSELDDLRLQLAEVGRQLDEARRAAEKEARLRIEASSSAKNRLAALQHELDTSRNDAIEQARRAAELSSQLEESARRDQQNGAGLAGLRQEIDRSASRIKELEGRLRETTQELEVAWRRVDEEKARTAAEAERLNELERKANDALQHAMADLASRYQEPLAEAKKSLEEAFTRIPNIERERDEARKAESEALAHAETLQAESGRVRALADQAAETAAGQAEEIAGLKSQIAAAATHEEAVRSELSASFDTKLQSIVSGITSDYEESLGEATVAREAARAEVRSLTARVETLQKQVQEQESFLRRAMAESASLRSENQTMQESAQQLRAEAEDARTKLELERSQRTRLEAEIDRKIASIAAGLTSDYENSLGEAMVEKEAARAEIRQMASKIAALEKQISEERQLVERARSEAVSGRDELLSEYSNKILQAEGRSATLLQEVERLQGELENARTHLELERSQRERGAADFDRKISSIVSGITGDHEQALGEAVVEKEAARAEARALANKLETMQRKLMDFDTLHAHVEKTTSELRRALEAERKRADDEKAAREKVEAEWSEKLQTIVANITSDHENDLGEALVQREAARAEARDLAGKLRLLQQKLDQERLRPATPAAPATVAGSTARPAVVLVVHSDAGIRAMSRHALEQSGYTVMTAADGLEGLRIATANRPDVILAEAVMPKMNGRELVQLLKARSETAGVKIVLMSSESSDGARAGDFRADDFLQTPADFATMRATLENVLAK